MTAHRMPGLGSSPIDREMSASNTDAMSLNHTFAGLLGGLCSWDLKGLHDHYRPFQSITCHVPMSQRRHRYMTTVQAFIDPDPTFILAASSEVSR